MGLHTCGAWAIMAPRINQPSTHTLEEEPQSWQFVPSAWQIPSASISNKHLELPSTRVLCRRAPKEATSVACGKEQPCHTGAQCGAPPEGLPKAELEPPAVAEDSHLSTSSPWPAATASGGAGRQRSYRHRQPPAASLPWIQPGAAQASRPSARGPGVQGPMLQEEMGGGGGIMPRRPGGGGYLQTVPGPPRNYLRGPAVGPPPSPSS